MIDVYDRNFVEDIRIFFGELPERFFVGGANRDDEVKRKFCRNEGEISRIDGAFFGRDENVVFVSASFGANGNDVVAFGIEGENEFADARNGTGDGFGERKEGKTLDDSLDGASGKGDGFLLTFEEIAETARGSEGVSIRAFGNEDEYGSGFFEEFFELVFGREGHRMDVRKKMMKEFIQ